MAKSITSKFKTNADWQKWDDAYSLLRAQEVLNDPKRSKAAKKMAGEMAKEKAQETSNLMKIAQEAFNAVESMVVASIENIYEAAGIKVPENSKERFKVAAGKAMKKKGWNKTKAVGLGVAIGKKGKK
jgi:hypothetical protein